MKKERLQADSYREGGVSNSVSSAMDAAIHTSLPTNQMRSSLDTTPWKPQGVLIMHMAEHKQAVNKVAVAENAQFFASASDDGTVKIWDSKRLEKDPLFRSRLTYTGQVSLFNHWPLRPKLELCVHYLSAEESSLVV